MVFNSNIQKYLLVFSFLFISSVLIGQTDYKVYFSSDQITPEISNLEVSLEVENSEIVLGRVYRYLQFYSIPTADQMDILKDKDIQLLDYIPSFTYIASLPAKTELSDLKESGLRSVWKVSSNRKLTSDIIFDDIPDYAKEGNDVKLIMEFYKDIQHDLALQLCEEKGIHVKVSNGINNFVEIKVKETAINEIANNPFVATIQPIAAPPVKDDRRGRSLHRVNKMDPNIAGESFYSGKGINVLVRDDGRLFDHIDFTGRVNQNFVGDSRGDHGDGVAGIMAGAGNLDPVNRGMAHGSGLYVVDYRSDFLDETMDLFFDEDVIVTNSSYSDGCNAGYTLSTRVVDQQLFDNPTLMHVFSAGNDGTSDCGYADSNVWGNITGGHKQAKNALTVANLNYLGEIMESSSRGPANDGRIKPDIAANGNNHVSTAEEHGYFNFGGTSGAAPVVAGVTAILHEAYEVTYGERGNAALLKAAMLNTANDYGNKGPDFIYGWGSLNGHKAMRLIEEGRFISSNIDNGEIKTHTIDIPDNVAEVRIMTYWPDAEAQISTNSALINNINSELIGPLDDIYLPWVLANSNLSEQLAMPATKGEDNKNNMEQIAIDNPMAGGYTLTLSGVSLPMGSGEYYVVYDFRMKDIDIIFPDGGTNVNRKGRDVIHWDAEGDEGEFLIQLLHADGKEDTIATVNGDRRLFEWVAPDYTEEFAKIRISRNGVSDESTAPFLLGNNPKNIQVIDVDTLPRALRWSPVKDAVSYNIYALGDKYMEYVISTDTNYFEIPNEDPFIVNWIAATAVFPEGTESKRSVAVTTIPAPTALATNNVNNMPCINKPVVFESQTTDTLVSYNWQFGSDALPVEAFTEGPHTVFYPSGGTKLAALTVTTDGGSDQTFFVLNVGQNLIPGSIKIEDIGDGEYSFKSTTTFGEEYLWDFGDGESIEGKNVTHQYTSSGNFTVSLLEKNRCDSLLRTEQVSVNLNAVEDLVASDFKIIPNPSSGNFNLLLPDLEGNEAELSISSIQGKIIAQTTLKNIEQRSFNITTSGLYIVKISIGENVYVKKLVID